MRLLLPLLLVGCKALNLTPPEPNCEDRSPFWHDADGDGRGDDAGSVYLGCEAPEGYTDIPPDTDTPADTDPVDTDTPADTDPVDTDPVDTDPVDTDPADTDPADTDPVDTDPVDTDPVDTDPVDTDPVDTTDSDTAAR